MSAETKSTDKSQKFSSYDIFIAMLSVLSIVNIVLFIAFSSRSILYVIGAIDIFLSVVFLFDFLYRFKVAESKTTYFIKDLGWADLLACAPVLQLKIFRLFRLVKAYSIVKRIGVKNIIDGSLRERASSALYAVLFTIILLLEFASIAILSIEGSSAESNIRTASDAIWWVYVTITTVGYGDKYPVTNQGRALGMVVMLVGVGLFGVLTGFLSNKFLAPKGSKKQESTEYQDLKKELQEIKYMLKDKAS